MWERVGEGARHCEGCAPTGWRAEYGSAPVAAPQLAVHVVELVRRLVQVAEREDEHGEAAPRHESARRVRVRRAGAAEAGDARQPGDAARAPLHRRVAAEGEQHLLDRLGEDEVRLLVDREGRVLAHRRVDAERDARHVALQPREVHVLALRRRELQRREPRLPAHAERDARLGELQHDRHRARRQRALADVLALVGEPAAQVVVEAALPLVRRELGEALAQLRVARRRQLQLDDAPAVDERVARRVVWVRRRGEQVEELVELVDGRRAQVELRPAHRLAKVVVLRPQPHQRQPAPLAAPADGRGQVALPLLAQLAHEGERLRVAALGRRRDGRRRRRRRGRRLRRRRAQQLPPPLVGQLDVAAVAHARAQPEVGEDDVGDRRDVELAVARLDQLLLGGALLGPLSRT